MFKFVKPKNCDMKKMKLSNLLAALLALVVCAACCDTPSGENYRFKDGVIVFDEPQRVAGQ